MQQKDAPHWFQALCWTTASSLWLVAFIITGLVNAWRATNPTWLLPALWAAEALVALCALFILRQACSSLINKLWQRPLLTFVGTTALTLGLITLGVYALALEKPQSSTPGHLKTVAVVGAGAAGSHAAWMLHHAEIDFTVFEAADYVGGHAYSPNFELANGEHFPVDVGFMFGSPNSYQEFKALLAYHGIDRVKNKLSISAEVNGTVWATGDVSTLSPEVHRFHELAARDYQNPATNILPFGWWLRLNGFDQAFREEYLAPYLSVLLLTTHGLYEQSTRFVLSMYSGQSKWLDYRTGADAWSVKNGSQNYYRKMTQGFRNRIRLQTPVTKIERVAGRVKVTSVDSTGTFADEWFDDVILAVPADVARVLLSDATPLESFVLSQVRYEGSQMALHTDTSVLPAPHLRRNYNYVQNETTGDGFQLNGMMGGALGYSQKIVPEPIVTVHPPADLQDIRVSRIWRHHVQDIWHIALMLELLPQLQGHGGVWYAGDWVKFIGHGPAMRSGLNAACHIGGVRPPAANSDEPCLNVVVEDKTPSIQLEEMSVEICGIRGLYQYLVSQACPEVLAEHKRTTLSQLD